MRRSRVRRALCAGALFAAGMMQAGAAAAQASAPTPDQPRPTGETGSADQAPRMTAQPGQDAAFGQAQAPTPLPAPPSSVQGRIAELEAQVAAMQAQLADLKAATSASFKDQRQAAAAADRVTIAAGKPSIQSADGRFVANLHGVMQFDAAHYDQDNPGPLATDLRRGAATGDTAHARDLNSGTNFRRARIGIDGKLFGDFGYNVLYDFGGSGAEDAGRVHELWMQYTGLKPFTLRVGAFPPSFGLEDANSTNGMPFLERPDVTDVARGLAAGDFRTAVQLSAAGDHWLVSGAVTGQLVSTLNSTGSATAQAYDEQLALVGRIAGTPLHGQDWLVHVGAHASYVLRPADAAGPDVVAGRYPVQFRERPELRVDGTRLVDTGGIDAEHASTVGLEFAAQLRNFYLQGEYEHFSIERRNSPLSDPDFAGFYVEGSWILTGEARKYNTASAAFDAPPVANPFDLKGGHWGAFELALRYSDLDLNYKEGRAGAAPLADSVRGGEQRILTGGLNWYLNPALRLMLDYQHVWVERLSPNAATFLTPVGAQIGQTFNTVALRSQFAF